jgi:hypothetical protein
MSDHQTRYLLAAENQESYERFAQVDEPERLEADLALARSLCERAANAGQPALAANLLATIARLSAAATAQKVRLGELLEKRAIMELGRELVALVTNVVKDRFVGWEQAIDQLADQVVATIEEKKNEDHPKPLLLEAPK